MDRFDSSCFEIFLDPPTSVTVTPSPIVVEEGNAITATCTATGNPQPTFKWFRSTDLVNPIDNAS
jgi:hypothetical protein